MKKSILTLAITAVLFGMGTDAVQAEIRTIEAEGSYVLNEELGESFQMARDQARRDALRMVSEQSVVWIESLSNVQASRLSKDEIRAISAGVLQIKKEDINAEVLADGRINYHCSIVAMVDSDSITREMLANRRALSDATQKNRELQTESDQTGQELERLKGKYTNASEPERKGIRRQMKVNEEKMEALRHFEQGNQFTAQKNYKEAADAYRKAIQIYPEYAIAYLELGNSLYELGDTKQALQYMKKAISLKPDNAMAHYNMGTLYYDQGEYEKAIQSLKKAIQLNPRYAEAYVNMGLSYKSYGNGDIEKAVECYKKALSIDPGEASAYNNLGSIYYNEEKYAEAIPCFQNAIHYNPWIEEPYGGLMKCYAHFGKYDEIKECAERFASAIDPVKSFVAWGDAYYYVVNDIDKASIYYNEAIKLDGGMHYAPALAACGDVLRDSKEYDLAEKVYGKALEADPENFRASMGLSMLHLQRGMDRISELTKDLDEEG